MFRKEGGGTSILQGGERGTSTLMLYDAKQTSAG